MPDLSVNPTFGPVDDQGNPTGITGAPNALQAAPHAPVYGVPYGYLADPHAEKTEPMPVFNDIDPFNPAMVETDPNMQTGLTQAMVNSMMAQNQQNLGIPASPPTTNLHQFGIDPSSVAMHGALLGALANQAVTQNDMATLAQNMSLAPPEGYEQAFSAPMSMADALNATVAAMNPSMSADDTGTQGEAPGFGLGPGGEDGDEGSGVSVGSGPGPGNVGPGSSTGPSEGPGANAGAPSGMGGIGSDAGQSPGQAGVSGDGDGDGDGDGGNEGGGSE